MATISDGATVITPAIVNGYSTSQASRNVLHDILGRSDYDVSLRPDAPRKGSLALVFATAADAEAARKMLTQPAVFTYSDPDVPSVGMRFVRDGDVSPVLDDETREAWVVTVGYLEVPA